MIVWVPSVVSYQPVLGVLHLFEYFAMLHENLYDEASKWE